MTEILTLTVLGTVTLALTVDVVALIGRVAVCCKGNRPHRRAGGRGARCER
jgi:hypothetical protein